MYLDHASDRGEGPVPESSSGVLEGRRVLVVEDEYLIADEIARTLSRAGAEVLGPVPSVAGALFLVDAEGRIDAALLDINLRGDRVWPVVDALRRRDVPVVFVSGYDAGSIPDNYAQVRQYQKPIVAGDLTRILVDLLAGKG